MLNQYQTTIDNIEKYNRSLPFIKELIPFIGDKKEVKIADIGSGAYSKIGCYLDGVKIEMYHSDNQDFIEFYKKYNVTPFAKIEYQDMEKLTYPDNYFDIVYCENALDHTFNAEKAVEEMIRVCKAGGFIYIDCHLNQLDTGHKHFWNAKEDGKFENYYEGFDLKKFGFKIQFINNGGESRYNHIIATLQKS